MRPRFATPHFVLDGLSRVALIGVALVAWQIISLYAIDPRFAALLPPVQVIFVKLIQALADVDTYGHILASATRALSGFFLAILVAIPLGVAMGWWRSVNRVVDPFVELLRPVPPIAWIPLSVLWFGVGELQKVYIIFLGTFFPILLNTIAGVRGIDREAVYGVLTLGGKPRDVIKDVVLPGMLPVALTGVRISIGIAWMVLVAAELTGAQSGLGYMMTMAREYVNTPVVIIGMVIVGALGFLSDRIMRYVQQLLTPWDVH